MKLFFMRHAVTEYNKEGRLQGRQDFPLSEEGKSQIALVDKELLREVEKIYCSPLLRAKQSAELLNLPCPIVFDQRLVERSFGSYEGKTYHELYEEGFDLKRAYDDDDYAFYDIETLSSMKKRMVDFLEDIKKEKEEKILLVSHGGLGLCLRQMFPQKKCDIQDLADIKNCQILSFDL